MAGIGLVLTAALWQPPVTVRADSADQATTYLMDSARTGGQPGDALAPPLTRRWSVDLGQEPSYPVIAGGRVYVVVRDGPPPGTPYGAQQTNSSLYALDLATGNVLWGPVVISNDGYAASLAYDTAAGVGRVFTVGEEYLDSSSISVIGAVRAFDPLTGTELWKQKPVQPGEPVAGGGSRQSSLAGVVSMMARLASAGACAACPKQDSASATIRARRIIG